MGIVLTNRIEQNDIKCRQTYQKAFTFHILNVVHFMYSYVVGFITLNLMLFYFFLPKVCVFISECELHQSDHQKRWSIIICISAVHKIKAHLWLSLRNRKQQNQNSHAQCCWFWRETKWFRFVSYTLWINCHLNKCFSHQLFHQMVSGKCK